MTTTNDDLINDMLRRAEACERLAAGNDDAATRQRCAGKAAAYRHAAELARDAVAAAEAERERLTAALRFLCRVDVGRCEFCGATATKDDPPLAWWCDVCAPPDAADHEHAATIRPLLPERGGAT